MDGSGMDPFGSGQGQVVGFCEHTCSNEASGFNKSGEFLCRPRNYYICQYFVLWGFLVDWFEIYLIGYILSVTPLRFFGGILGEVALNLCEMCGKGSGT
jgi:hypothetical protein